MSERQSADYVRPHRHLCPDADYRDTLSDDDFWAHVFRAYTDGPDVEDDWDVPPLDPVQATSPCPLCGEFGACGYDAEGRAMIHAVSGEVEGDG